MKNNIIKKARDRFMAHGGIMSTSEAISSGIHPRTLYMMRDKGEIEKLERGLYRLAGLPPLSNPDLVPVAKKVPKGVVCLVSALSFHELTTQIPHEVYIALPQNTEKPRISNPPIRVFWLTGNAYSEGIDVHTIDGISVKIYSVEKTIADCFKYRNKLGLDVALEALKDFRKKGELNLANLIYYSKICRVENIIRPYLEALI